MGGEDSEEDDDCDDISFEDFLDLMAPDGEFASIHPELASDDTIGILRRTFKAFHKQTLRLAETSEEQKAKHKRLVFLLDVVPAPVILLNAAIMGLRIDIDPNALVWKVFDIFFLFFYSGEAMSKMYVFGNRVYYCGPEWMWNALDIACVLISLMDVFITYILPLFLSGDDSSDVGSLMLVKMLRLAKLARLIKALHYPI